MPLCEIKETGNLRLEIHRYGLIVYNLFCLVTSLWIRYRKGSCYILEFRILVVLVKGNDIGYWSEETKRVLEECCDIP